MNTELLSTELRERERDRLAATAATIAAAFIRTEQLLDKEVYDRAMWMSCMICNRVREMTD